MRDEGKAKISRERGRLFRKGTGNEEITCSLVQLRVIHVCVRDGTELCGRGKVGTRQFAQIRESAKAVAYPLTASPAVLPAVWTIFGFPAAGPSPLEGAEVVATNSESGLCWPEAQVASQHLKCGEV